MKNSEVNNKHRNNDGKFKTILSIWYLTRKIFSDGILMNHRSRLFIHGGIQQWEINYRKTYSPVVN